MLSKVRSTSKATVRHLLDRALLPYFDNPPPAGSPAVDGVADQAAESAREAVNSDTFHHVLHELRTLELERIPIEGGRFLSVGASGRWYFDWFDAHVGSATEHIGVEAFEGVPDDLPDYVRWIESTADRFDGVDADSVDLVFAGQTTEHLWADEMVGFLTEANRVLVDGGLLVADSPNRLITEHLRWSHGGHTVELSAGEMRELMTLAGFDIISTRGAWLCELEGRVLELEEDMDSAALVARRTALGGEDPDGSFVWWIVATKSGAPQVDALTERVAQLYDEHWSTRVSRGMWPGPGSRGPMVTSGHTGLICESLPMFVQPGNYRLTVSLDEGEWADLVDFRVDITSPGHHLIHRLSAAEGVTDGGSISWEFERDELIFALSLELHVSSVTGPVRIHMPVRIEPV